MIKYLNISQILHKNNIGTNGLMICSGRSDCLKIIEKLMELKIYDLKQNNLNGINCFTFAIQNRSWDVILFFLVT